ncbi:hypothetical protein [Vibrio sp. WXL210]|uniref:hypothetical protein n=1 Tax=Vibrio sp. WXL210 TaxID=3450709 RepID=UPI003EC4CC2D
MRAGISLIIASLTAIAGFYLVPAVSAWYSTPTVPACFASTQACTFDDKRVVLDSDKVQPLSATKLSVTWPSDTEELSIKLRGIEMEMGEVRAQLVKVDNNLYQTDIVLPICSTHAMTWRGEITDGNDTIAIGIRMAR